MEREKWSESAGNVQKMTKNAKCMLQNLDICSNFAAKMRANETAVCINA